MRKKLFLFVMLITLVQFTTGCGGGGNGLFSTDNSNAPLQEETISVEKLDNNIIKYDSFSSLSNIILSPDGTKLLLSESSGFTAGYDNNHILTIIDVSNPSKPHIISHYDKKEVVVKGIDISSDGKIAYLAAFSIEFFTSNPNGLYVVDISNPSNPSLLGTYDTDVTTEGVVISNDNKKAFLIGEDFYVIDVTNPSNPSFIGKNGSYGNILTVSNNDNIILTGSDVFNGTDIINVSNPSNPNTISGYDTNGSVNGIVLSKDNKKAYIVSENDGLLILDISNPATPKLLSKYNYPDLKNVQDIKISHDGKKVYVTDSSKGLIKIDVTNPKNPYFIKQYRVSDISGYSKFVLSPDETKAFVLIESFVSNSILVIDLNK